jgi:predicted NBD/HSP70 family sugar kinase
VTVALGVARETFAVDARKSTCFNGGTDERYLTHRHASHIAGSPGDLLDLIRSGEATTRAELASSTGLARSTISQRIDQLSERDLIVEIGEARSTGGRPPSILGFNVEAGVVLAADLGATHSRLAVADLGGTVLAETTADMAIAEGPDAILSRVAAMFSELLLQADHDARDVVGVGIGVPGPVEFAEGRAVDPPIMPGWDGYDIRERFVDIYRCPVLVDNDVNMMAAGEHWILEDAPDDFLFIKIGTGIGSGLILGGELHRGAQGTAGDIGHVQVHGTDLVCRCGNPGCLEATAGGAALASQLASLGYATTNSRDVVELVRSGNPDAIRAVRDAGRLIGRVLATVVNLLNPAVITIGGDVAEAGEHLMAGIREVVYQRSTALSTSKLFITSSALGDRAGITGAAATAIEHIVAPSYVNAALEREAVSIA